jgi:osmotically-inducible protein OsmY
LQRDILDELAWEPRVDAADIGVSVEDGVVILNDRVKSLIEKWVAERVAQRVEGVRAVTDELVVKLPGENQYADADLACAAANALDWNASVPRSRITILVEDGWIHLKGNVDHQYQKDRRRRLCAF